MPDRVLYTCDEEQFEIYIFASHISLSLLVYIVRVYPSQIIYCLLLFSHISIYLI